MSQSESVSERELRSSKTLTSEGDQLFEQSNERHQYIIRTIKRDIYIILDVEDNPVVDLSTVSTYREELLKLSDKYEKEAYRYFDFLKSYRTRESELLHREATLKAEKNVLAMKRDVDEAESGLQAVKKALDFDLKDYGESYEPPRIANPVVQHANEDRMSERKYRSANVPDTRKCASFLWVGTKG